MHVELFVLFILINMLVTINVLHAYSSSALRVLPIDSPAVSSLTKYEKILAEFKQSSNPFFLL